MRFLVFVGMCIFASFAQAKICNDTLIANKAPSKGFEVALKLPVVEYSDHVRLDLVIFGNSTSELSNSTIAFFRQASAANLDPKTSFVGIEAGMSHKPYIVISLSTPVHREPQLFAYLNSQSFHGQAVDVRRIFQPAYYQGASLEAMAKVSAEITNGINVAGSSLENLSVQVRKNSSGIFETFLVVRGRRDK